jgi:DNA invertase Pin-like site-specific DNA recombinase
MPADEGCMTAAIYARFSSDLQTEKSIEDQVARCQAIAMAEGLGLCRVFSDSALSGASMGNRPGLHSLLEAIRDGRVTALVTESLDRISRNQADLHTVVQTAQYRGVRLITASDGEIMQGSQGEIMVGLRGIVGAMYLKDLADKTRRGLEGVARSGRIPGGLCYGYRAVPGEVRGLREIDEGEAEVVRRIYTEYDDGRSPREIMKALIAEGVPGPRGKRWGLSTLLGNAKRLNGILCNPLYRGELVFNRQRKVKNPETGRAKMAPNPPEMWQRYEMPELAIVPADLWSRVHARRLAGASTRPEYQRKPKRVLSGLMRCGACGGPFGYVAQGPRYGCTTRRNTGDCSNSRTIRAERLEGRVLAGLRERALAPEAVEYAVACYRERMEELEGKKIRDHARLERELAKCEATVQQARKMLRAGSLTEWMVDEANAAELRAKEIRAELEEADAPSVVRLHPEAAGQYRALVEEMNTALATGDEFDSRSKAVAAIRNLITAIIVSPGEKRGEVYVDVEGDLAALLDNQEGGRDAVTLGAGVGFGRYRNTLPFKVIAG